MAGKTKQWEMKLFLARSGSAANEALALTAAAPIRERWPDLAALIAVGEDEAISTRLRRAEAIGRPIGAPEFLEQLERDGGRALAPGKRGRKAKSGVSP